MLVVRVHPLDLQTSQNTVERELQSKMQESNQQVKTLHENIAALKELHRAEFEELKREVEKQVFITQTCNVSKGLQHLAGLLLCTRYLLVMLTNSK